MMTVINNHQLVIKMKYLNLKAAEIAFEDVKLRLADSLDNKKAIELKVYAVLGGYITVSMGLFGFALLSADKGYQLPLFILGLIFLVGCLCLLFALKTKPYGYLGSTPDAWIRKGVIDGDNQAIACNLAFICNGYEDHIQISDYHNMKMFYKLQYAVYGGIVASIASFIYALMFLILN